MTAPRETGGEGRGDVWENPDPKRLKAAPHTMDDEALASLVEIFAEDHPYVGVQMGMWEAASRLRRYAATPRETGAEGREAVRLIRSALYRLAEIDAGPNDDFRREWRRICTHYDDILERALATPRPVEVTEDMVEAGKVLLPNVWAPDTDDHRRLIVRAILTAALRAQPAGGTPCPLSTHGPFCEPSHTHPAPVADAGGTPPLPTKCPRCGYFTADVFSCPTCADPSTPFAAPTLPPVGERPIPRYDERAFEENGELGVHFRLDPNGDWVRYADVAALLATRPSPAPSGEPVRFEYRFKREPDHDWTLWGGRMEAGHFSRDQRDAIANQYRQEGYVVETRDLYAASPAPSGERPVMAMVKRNGGWSVMWDEPEPPALEALPDGHYNLYLAAAPHPDGAA